MPSIKICEKCRYWYEYCGLFTNDREAIMCVGCRMPNGRYCEMAFNGNKYSAIRKCIAGNARGNKKPCGCYNGSPTFRDVSELVREEYDALRKEYEGEPAVMDCQYYAEQQMEEWNA